MAKRQGTTRRRTSKPQPKNRTGIWLGVLVLLVGGSLLGYIGYGALEQRATVPPEQTVATMGSGCSPLDSGRAGVDLRANNMAPNFTLPIITAQGISGITTSLSSFRGRLVVLEFTISSCAVSQTMTTVLKSLNQKYSDRGLVFLSVGGTFMGADLTSTAKFIRDNRVDWTMVFDEHDSAFYDYGVKIAPSYFVVGMLGRILVKLEGQVTYLGFTNILDEILGGTTTASMIGPGPSISVALCDSVSRSFLEAQSSPLDLVAYRAQLLWSRIEQ
jgi:peroxiredoxin